MLRRICEHRWVLRGVWLALAGVVMFLSLLPGDSQTLRVIGQIIVDDKLQHGIAYAPLAFLPTLYERRKPAALCILAIALMGVAMEFGQLHVEGRSFDARDMMANCAGLSLGFLLALPMRLKLGSGK